MFPATINEESFITILKNKLINWLCTIVETVYQRVTKIIPEWSARGGSDCYTNTTFFIVILNIICSEE